MRISRTKSSPRSGRRPRRRTAADSLLMRVANPYIGRSIGESVAEDSGSADVEESAETAPTAVRPMPFSRPSLTRFLMIFLFLLALYAIIDPPVGAAFAAYANVVLFPMFGFGGTLSVFPSWVLLYSLLALPFGQIVVRVLKYFRFRRRLQAMGVPLRAGPDETA